MTFTLDVTLTRNVQLDGRYQLMVTETPWPYYPRLKFKVVWRSWHNFGRNIQNDDRYPTVTFLMENSLYKRNMNRNNSKIAYLHILLARGVPTISDTYTY